MFILLSFDLFSASSLSSTIFLSRTVPVLALKSPPINVQCSSPCSSIHPLNGGWNLLYRAFSPYAPSHISLLSAISKGIYRKSDRFRKSVVRQRYSEKFVGFVAVERVGSARCTRLTVLITSQLSSCFIFVTLINT